MPNWVGTITVHQARTPATLDCMYIVPKGLEKFSYHKHTQPLCIQLMSPGFLATTWSAMLHQSPYPQLLGSSAQH